MKENRVVPFNRLEKADLVIDAIYKGGDRGNTGDDPITKLIGGPNQGGFRPQGSTRTSIKLCALYSDLINPDWPDSLDLENGLFVYFGDNRTPGHEPDETSRKGNIILRQAYNNLHLGKREEIPPFFVFIKGPQGRDVVFRGLAVPGGKSISQTEDLITVWKTKSGSRFANYRSIFTILDISCIPRDWISDLQIGKAFSKNAPKPWIDWVRNGRYSPLLAPRTKTFRTREEQLPTKGLESNLVTQLVDFFKSHVDREYAFERCAGELFKLAENNKIQELNYTRYWRDGGRDAIGTYKIGIPESSIYVDFALEAKCNKPGIGSGIKATSRLISRLKFRQFGIFVTTSYVGQTACQEIIEDGHPIVILCGHDIATILIRAGINSPELLGQWLNANFTENKD
jgi:hypothetical protein